MKIKVEAGPDICLRYLSMSTWRNKRNTRSPSSEAGPQRKTKRERVVGNATMRNIYKHAHGYKHPNYSSLCAKVDRHHKGQ